jgi:DNA-binding beta-propeller fold protein YncE
MVRVKVLMYTFLFIVISTGFSAGQEVELFGMVFEGGTVEKSNAVDDNTNRIAAVIDGTVLYRIDPVTGQTIKIGETGMFQCTGMDFHPTTRELYAACYNRDVVLEEANTKLLAGDVYLVKINTMTGEAREIGPTGVVPVFGARAITDLSFRSDGTLLGHAQAEGGSILGTIDLRTGEFTQIGVFEAEIMPGGLAFSADGRLYSADTYTDTWIAAIHMRDQSTGDGSAPTNLNLALEEGQSPLVTSMDLNPADEMIYGYLLDQGVRRSAELNSQRLLEMSYIVVIDPATGNVDFRTPIEETVYAIAFRPALTVSNIPTMGEWGLIALSGLMLAGAVLVLRRRYRSSTA